MDRSKASKLSDKIHNAVDEYLLSRDLPDLKASVNRKRWFSVTRFDYNGV